MSAGTLADRWTEAGLGGPLPDIWNAAEADLAAAMVRAEAASLQASERQRAAVGTPIEGMQAMLSADLVNSAKRLLLVEVADLAARRDFAIAELGDRLIVEHLAPAYAEADGPRRRALADILLHLVAALYVPTLADETPLERLQGPDGSGLFTRTQILAHRAAGASPEGQHR
jgi:hypothetical protein